LPAIEQLEAAGKAACAAGRGETGVVRIGILTSLASGFLRDVVQSYAARHPDISIDIHDGSRNAHIAAIRGRRLDIAFLTGTGTVSDCETSTLWEERVHVAVAKGHKLADRRMLDWADIRGERFIVSRIAPGPEVHDYIVRRAADYSSFPDVEVKDVGRETLMNLVGLGQGITLVSAAWAVVKLPGLVLRPLSAPDDVIPFSAVWSAQNDNPALRRFVSIAHVLAGRCRHGSSDWLASTVGFKQTDAEASVTAQRPDRSP